MAASDVQLYSEKHDARSNEMVPEKGSHLVPAEHVVNLLHEAMLNLDRA